ncbi:MAG TPA: YbaK/EbsC family protein [Ktedonobacterales bacterium]|jgi:Ala-tRNA(Pro) deacylase
MQCKERLEGYLQQQHIPYQVQEHPIAYTAQDVAYREHIPGKLVAKEVIIYAAGKPVMLVLPAPYRVDFARVKQALGTEEVRLADEGELSQAFPDCEVGAMPPFGNLYQLPVYVERSLAEDETIVFPVGTHTETMSLKYADFERLVAPTLAEFAHPAQAVQR